MKGDYSRKDLNWLSNKIVSYVIGIKEGNCSKFHFFFEGIAMITCNLRAFQRKGTMPSLWSPFPLFLFTFPTLFAFTFAFLFSFWMNLHWLPISPLSFNSKYGTNHHFEKFIYLKQIQNQTLTKVYQHKLISFIYTN